MGFNFWSILLRTGEKSDKTEKPKRKKPGTAMKRKVQSIPVDDSGNLTITLNINKGIIVIDVVELNI